MTEQKITLELTELEAKALENALFALQDMPVGAAIRAKQYEWQKESITTLREKLEAQRYSEK